MSILIKGFYRGCCDLCKRTKEVNVFAKDLTQLKLCDNCLNKMYPNERKNY